MPRWPQIAAALMVRGSLPSGNTIVLSALRALSVNKYLKAGGDNLRVFPTLFANVSSQSESICAALWSFTFSMRCSSSLGTSRLKLCSNKEVRQVSPSVAKIGRPVCIACSHSAIMRGSGSKPPVSKIAPSFVPFMADKQAATSISERSPGVTNNAPGVK